MTKELDNESLLARVKQLESNLYDCNQNVALLKDAADASSSEHRLDDVLEMVAQKARRLMHAETLLIPILDSECKEYTYKAGCGADSDEIVGESLPMDFGICGWVWEHKRAWWIGVLDELNDDEREKWQHDLGNVMLVPMQGKRHFLGGIAAINKEGGGHFDERDLQLLTMFAGYVSIAIENAMFYEDIEAARQVSEAQQKQLERLNQELETRVEKRTKEVNNALKELHQVANDLAREKAEQQKLIIKLENQDVLREANKKLEAATKSKSAFLANMSHEIRTPLTAIIGFGESLLDTDSTMSDRIAAINSIISNGTHLQQIINDILDISKIEAEKLEIEIMDVPLFELIADMESLMMVQTRERGLKTCVNYAFPLPVIIKSDPLRLKQILINLCSNAIKFTKKGRICLDIRCDPINEQIQFDITDTGIGLKADELSKIFDTFTQADSSTTRCFGGTGLGLPLSKQLAKMLGGTITVSSEFNKGSRFTVVINTGKLISEEFIDALPKKTALSEILPEADSNTKLCGHILLAEDTLDNQRLISMYIHKLGADVTIVENGQLALDAALNGNFDLILMDMQMPVMDGIEAVQALRKKGYSGPIVALTANVMKEDRANCAAAGCDDFASKPIKRDLFNEILHRYLPSQVVEIEHPTSIVSDLIEEGPEFAELVELFVKQLPLTLKNIQDAVQQEQWSSLKTLTHDLKGVGGGMGFPMLTKLAQTIEFQLAKESYKEINNSINELNTMCESIYQGHNSDS